MLMSHNLKGSLEHLDSADTVVIAAGRDSRATADTVALVDILAHLEQVVLVVTQVLESLVTVDTAVIPEHLDSLATVEPVVLLDLADTQEPLEQVVIQDIRDSVELQASLVIVALECLASLAILDQE